MKNFTFALSAFICLLIISCEGPEGIPGLNGANGLDGEPGIEGQVFEVENINFDYSTNTNSYNTILTFTDFTSFNVLEEDAILVYRFDGSTDFQDGTTANNWSLVPQSFFLTEGTIQYTSSHTLNDVEIVIDGNFNLANLDSGFIDAQVFRIVIVPSKFATSSKIDTSKITNVLSALHMEETQILKYKK